ncbi:MAG: hypothetical protein A2V88_08850 [Elusimicrobia bacterium RBG_16_66_12]|nr:MAG: hypothetical protein A2V88_08850 [Elusimicrobia bacterium RBG_16_66_12]
MAGFGGFTYAADERPAPEADTGWVTALKLDRATPLGSARDSIVTLGVGSASRMFELYLTLARYAAHLALVNTVATFTDWEDTPDSRSAFLAGVTPVDYAGPWAGVAANTIRVRVELISQ